MNLMRFSFEMFDYEYLPGDINKSVLIKTKQVPIKSKVKETIMKLHYCFVTLSIG